MKRLSIIACLAMMWTTSAIQAQREFCTGDACIPDTLEVDFGGMSELVLDEFVAGQEVPFQVFTNTETGMIQGWSYALSHDTAVLSIVADSVTTVGTIAHPDTEGAVAIPPNFDVSQAVDGGLISAIVLSFLTETELPVGSRSAILNGTYSIDADPGTEGTEQMFLSGAIGPAGSPPTDINFTVDGASREPATVIDGLIRVGGPVVEICDNQIDDDGDGMVDCDDEDCADDIVACPPVGDGCPEGSDWAFYFGGVGEGEVDVTGADSAPISMRNASDALAFQLGVSYADGVHSFSESLGADEERLIALIITDENGDSQTPATPTTARGAAATGLSRGAAIDGFSDGDFFAFDLAPALGGPGFTVGYVSDLDGNVNRIPATADEDPCPSNEILVISFEAVTGARFIRGDADGSGELNVTDAVLIINVTLGNLPARFDCEDALDANDDGSANISDAIPVLMYMFQRGAPLAAPHLECGLDPTAEDLGCAEDTPACSDAA